MPKEASVAVTRAMANFTEAGVSQQKEQVKDFRLRKKAHNTNLPGLLQEHKQKKKEAPKEEAEYRR